jgi:hypothetical protein
MADPNSIIDLGKLSEPATLLVQKISDALGGLARPWQIVRVAEAQAKADKIDAVAKIEITELQQRAMRRMILEEERKQNNIEGIIAKALPQLEEGAAPKKVEDDWIANFFDKCRLISDEEMQQLWSKVLAGEVNAPGRFSKRTISLMASLDKADAETFTRLCDFRFAVGPLIYDINDAIYKDRGLTFSDLSHLETIGLIAFDHIAGYSRQNLPQRVLFGYFDTSVYLEFKTPPPCQLNVGKVIFTISGHQLSTVCTGNPVEGFVDYVRQKWRDLGHLTEMSPEVAAANHQNEKKP